MERSSRGLASRDDDDGEVCLQEVPTYYRTVLSTGFQQARRPAGWETRGA